MWADAQLRMEMCGRTAGEIGAVLDRNDFQWGEREGIYHAVGAMEKI